MTAVCFVESAMLKKEATEATEEEEVCKEREGCSRETGIAVNAIQLSPNFHSNLAILALCFAKIASGKKKVSKQ